MQNISITFKKLCINSTVSISHSILEQHLTEALKKKNLCFLSETAPILSNPCGSFNLTLLQNVTVFKYRSQVLDVIMFPYTKCTILVLEMVCFYISFTKNFVYT